MTEQSAKSEHSWAAPIARLDEAWQDIEAWLCAGVLIAEIVSLAAWIALKGLSQDYQPGLNAAGLVCRRILTAAFLGIAFHVATRRMGGTAHKAGATIGVFLGLFAGRLWMHAGVHWGSN